MMLTNLLVWLTISVQTNASGGTYELSPTERLQSNRVDLVTTFTFLDPREGHQHAVSVSETNLLVSISYRERLTTNWIIVPLIDTNAHRVLPPMPPIPSFTTTNPLYLTNTPGIWWSVPSNVVPVQGSPPSPKVTLMEGNQGEWITDLPRSPYKLPGTPANLERARRTSQ